MRPSGRTLAVAPAVEVVRKQAARAHLPVARLGKGLVGEDFGLRLAFLEEHTETKEVPVDALAVGRERGVRQVPSAGLAEELDALRVLLCARGRKMEGISGRLRCDGAPTRSQRTATDESSMLRIQSLAS